MSMVDLYSPTQLVQVANAEDVQKNLRMHHRQLTMPEMSDQLLPTASMKLEPAAIWSDQMTCPHD